MWGLLATTYWAGMHAFGITSPGVTGVLFVQSVAALGIAIPISPGYVGPFEAAVRFALGAYAIPTDTIVAYALTLHVLMVTSLITIGLGLTVRLGLSEADFTPWNSLPSTPHFDGAARTP